MKDHKQHIINNIQRFQSLRRFSSDYEFIDQLNKLHHWQHQRMSQTYQRLLQQDKEKPLMHFFLEDIYRGIDISHIGGKLEKAVKVADKLFTDLGLIDIAFEFNAVTGVLDEALAQQLFSVANADRITHDTYVSAVQALGNKALRMQQLQLIREFAHGLDEVIQDKAVYRAFKLGKIPAKLGGLNSLYQLMDRGFDAMLSIDNSEALIKQVVDHEQKYFEAIYSGQPCVDYF